MCINCLSGDKVVLNENQIITTQEELNQFERYEFLELVKPLNEDSIIDTKWVFKKKLDKNGAITRNKARLLAQGYYQ